MNLKVGLFRIGTILHNSYSSFVNKNSCFLNPRYLSPIFNVRFISLEEKVGLPPKPKRPLNPFFRFLKQIRPTIIQNNPSASTTDITRIAGQEWDKVEPKKKQEFEDAYKKEQEAFVIEKLKYESQFTEEDRRKIMQARQDKQHVRMLREKRKKYKDLEKPKKAPTAYIIWVKKRSNSRGPNETAKAFLRRLAEEWKNLSDAEKQPFIQESKQLQEKYYKNMIAWEEEMIRTGNLDVVRNEAKLELSKSEKSAKSKKTQ